MVYGAVASDGSPLDPHFIESNFEINTKEYLVILKTFCYLWWNRHLPLTMLCLPVIFASLILRFVCTIHVSKLLTHECGEALVLIWSKPRKKLIEKVEVWAISVLRIGSREKIIPSQQRRSVLHSAPQQGAESRTSITLWRANVCSIQSNIVFRMKCESTTRSSLATGPDTITSVRFPRLKHREDVRRAECNHSRISAFFFSFHNELLVVESVRCLRK